MNHFEVIVIGAGPAGLFAAASIRNKKILLIEKNKSLGRKLLISGAGRCNITHSGNIRDFFSHYGENSRFLKHALNSFTNEHLIHFIHSGGLKTIEDKNGKIFPASDDANDILKVLKNACIENGVVIKTECPIKRVSRNENSFVIQSDDQTFTSDILVISTGGKSYPSTGSEGDGYHFAQSFGHTITKLKPALTPVFVNNFPFADLSGISLTEKKLSLYRNDKKIKEHFGDFGFTHKGLSGPGILDFSRYFEPNDILKINLVGLTPEELRLQLIDAAEHNGKSNLKNFLKKLNLPENLIRLVLEYNSIDSEITLATITKEIRNRVISLFSELSFPVDKVGGYNIAMATSGGVCLNEVNSKTMESKIKPNLYFAGEVLDIDGDTGGYNIQAALSTAFVASLDITNKKLY